MTVFTVTVISVTTAMIDEVVEALGLQVGIDLKLAEPPRPLTGGFWATMSVVRLRTTDALPTALAGDLVVRLMRTVADAGNAVVFISHRLHEVATVADRVTVLRDGLVESMSVLENMGVASGYGARLFSPLSMARERRISTELLAELGLTLSLIHI